MALRDISQQRNSLVASQWPRADMTMRGSNVRFKAGIRLGSLNVCK